MRKKQNRMIKLRQIEIASSKYRKVAIPDNTHI